MEEPPHTRPRQTMTLMHLWRTSDVADGIAQFLPTKDISVTIPNLAKTFERDHWRLLTAMMRRARRGTTAACKTALLSTLQMAGRESGHFHEDWAGNSPWREFKTNEEETVVYTTDQSRGTFVMNRTTPKSATHMGVCRDLAGVSDRCCVRRFCVSLAYTGSYEATAATGTYFRLSATTGTLMEMCIRSDGTGGFRLRWRTKKDDSSPTTSTTLKRVLGEHTFHIDATLDWRTATATVTVDGVRIEQPVPFEPLPLNIIAIGVNNSGIQTVGPIDVWYFSAPPPQLVPSVRFATDPDDGWDFDGGVDE